ERRADECGEQRMRLERLGFELRMEMANEKPRGVRCLDDFHVIIVRRPSGDTQSGGPEDLFGLAVEIVTVAMPLADLCFAVSLVRKGTWLQFARPGAQAHGSAHFIHAQKLP